MPEASIYEKGLNRVGAGRLQAIADLLEVPVSTLYGGDGHAGSDVVALLNTPHAAELLQLFDAMPATYRGSLLTIARGLLGPRDT
ncbi:hypothetical protein [Methylobacterium nodulans]|uniref:XRE family transcriptional regulator n=1 Tax=Methylobacterium nodulans (strain LMG 21967 / CNCM I-2342 / ORS 2060) TaxID=460265 RepID=B8IMX8_METNO|nr:XRE family transcriptional regulator [Methylobacterium nodulans ORS 2060]